MTGIIRSWICENSRCSEWFESWDANPECPKCKCVRVSWRPNGGHMGGHSKSADAELRALVDAFKLDNLNSAERGRAAKVIKTPPPVPAGSQMHTFGQGFTAAINPAAGAQCVPVSNKIDYKIKAAPGTALAPNPTFPSVRSHTSVEASSKGTS
jgi:hypothetical protein